VRSRDDHCPELGTSMPHDVVSAKRRINHFWPRHKSPARTRHWSAVVAASIVAA
jgi:hypothetical protein